MKIVKPSEAPAPQSTIVMLYGEPGVGKTSFALSSKNPLLLPFDRRGSLRPYKLPDFLEIGRWEDALDLTAEGNIDELRNYDAIVLDTVDMALEKLTDYITRQDPRMRNKNGGLTLQGYGALKAGFSNWMRAVMALGINIVFVAHAKHVEENGLQYAMPAITGGSYDNVMQQADLVGYMTMEQHQQRVVDFASAMTHVGKDFAHLAKRTISTWEDEGVEPVQGQINSIEDVYDAAKAAFAKHVKKSQERAVSEGQAEEAMQMECMHNDGEPLAILENCKNLVANQGLSKSLAQQIFARVGMPALEPAIKEAQLEGPDTLTEILNACNASELLHSKAKTQAKKAVKAKMEAEGLAYDTESQAFIPPQTTDKK